MINIDDVKDTIKALNDDLTNSLIKLQNETNMEDDVFVQIASDGYKNAMGISVNVIEILKRNELVDEQIKTEKQNQLIKEQQELAEKIKNGGIYYKYIKDENGNIIKELQNGTTKSIYEIQKELENAKIKQIDEEIIIRNNLADADISIKSQQELAEKIKNGGVYYLYAYDSNNNIIGKKLQNGTTKSIYEYQRELTRRQTELAKKQTDSVGKDIENKTEQKYTVIAKRKRELGATTDKNGKISYTKDKSSLIEKQIEYQGSQTTYIGKQGTNLDKQVKQNCLIQAMDKLEGYNMGIGNAGLIPNSTMHTNFFSIAKTLVEEGGGDSGSISTNISDLKKYTDSEEESTTE